MLREVTIPKSSHHAFQARRDSQVPDLREVSICGRGAGRRWIQVPQDVLQVLHVQQGAGLDQLQRAREGSVLQAVPRPQVRTQGLRVRRRRRRAQHGHRRPVRQQGVGVVSGASAAGGADSAGYQRGEPERRPCRAVGAGRRHGETSSHAACRPCRYNPPGSLLIGIFVSFLFSVDKKLIINTVI
ncbi:hypothetical protein FJT64_010210 [Amphibalanus amphitrite]|uniref:Uncharacterized protein n=1 Tax=Amphibalanus amphitrite TaxID=1232801 RepID=A0A6A4VCW4_AMPAM|nr:hypothetical protein FJT64_010210 [Amphibalanus amphitrite]